MQAVLFDWCAFLEGILKQTRYYFLHRGLLVLDKARDFVHPLRSIKVRLQNISHHASTTEEGVQEIVDRNSLMERGNAQTILQR